MLSIYLFYTFSECSFIGERTFITNGTSLFDYNGPDCKKAKHDEDPNIIQLNVSDTCKSIEKSYVTYNSRNQNSIVPKSIEEKSIEIRYDQVSAQLEYIKETEIYNNHEQQRTNEIEQDMMQKIETCKNRKKNKMNFIDLTEETKKPFYDKFAQTQNKTTKKDTEIKKHLIRYYLYKLNNFMKNDVIETFDIAKYIPEYITKYAFNKEIFDTQTEAIKTLFNTGVIDFDEFFSALDEEICYDDNDKETLAELVDVQMNDFLHTNINSLTLLFPKMQFFMEYYNKYQDDLVFFENTKQVCMVYGMMHILETILQCTEHIVNEIKEINNDIIKCSNSEQKYKHYGLNSKLPYFLATKCEIEKMLLYILQPFLPTDHFIDLANLFHVESVCSLSIYKFYEDGMRFEKPNKIESAMLRMSMYCFIYFDALETGVSGTQKNETYIFFRHIMNQNNAANVYKKKNYNYSMQELYIFNACFSIYICKNADKLYKDLTKTYIRLKALYKRFQNIVTLDITKNNEKNKLQNEITNKNKTLHNIIDDKKPKLKRKQVIDKNAEIKDNHISFHTCVFYVLNCMSNYIIASEAAFIMSYDITVDKKEIEDVLVYYMLIMEKWNDINHMEIEYLDINIPFKRPKFRKTAKMKSKKSKKPRNTHIR